MTKRLTALAATTLAGALLATTATTPAGAATTPTSTTPTSTSTTSSTSTTGTTTTAGSNRLPAIQAKAAADIAGRVSALNQTIPAVTGNGVISTADKATLLSTLQGDLNGLTALGQKIAADTTADQAASDAATIFTGYRVYALALPQVRYAEAVDDLTGTALPKLVNAQAQLTAALTLAPGKNTATVQAAMTDLGTQIATATTDTNGLSGTVLAFTPAQYDANHALLSQPRATLVAAPAAAGEAAADIQTVVTALS